MKKRKVSTTLLTGAMALTGLMASAPVALRPVTTLAASSNVKATGGSVNIEKYLVLKSNAEVPNVTFDFSISGSTEMSASTPVENGLQVYSGTDTSKVTGTPTIGTAVFKSGDTKYNSVQDLVSNGIQVKEGAKDPVTLKSDQSYAKHDVQVDFSGVSFNEPGIYRYKITESTDKTGTVTNDADATRYMDVYVVDAEGNGTLSVQGYVLHANDVKVSQDGSSVTSDAKSEGYVNTMEDKDLSIKKQVSGNQASKDEYFKFTLNVKNALPNTTYNVDLSKADTTTKTNGVNTEAHTNPATFTTDESGNATVEFWLQHGQEVTVRSLSIGSDYVVSEDKTSMNNEGYTSEIVNADDTDGVTNLDFSTNGRIEKADADEIDITFTNKKSGTIPTGVVMAIAPFAAVTLFGSAGAATIVMKKKKND